MINLDHELRIVDLEIFGTVSAVDMIERTVEAISLQYKHSVAGVLVDAFMWLTSAR